MTAPGPLWTPSEQRRRTSRLQAFIDSAGFAGYDEAWRWSVSPTGAGEFWAKVGADLGVVWREPPHAALETDPSAVPGVRWFPGALLNYAENALRPRPGAGHDPAVISLSQTRPTQQLDLGELTTMTSKIRDALARTGVRKGDRVAAYLPNIPETLAAMLASASLGAVWSCCAPETGVAAVLDRFSQIEPKVLLCVDGYRFGDKAIDRRQQAVAIREGLPTVAEAIWLPYLDAGTAPPAGWTGWEEFTAGAPGGALEFEPVGFDHPLYVLYSSGTTGKPKPIVHGHGGITLEHAKALALHFDVGPGDRLFWFTTTGWMMWNFCVSGLLAGAAVVMFDGDPGWPSMEALWAVMSSTATTCGGVGSGFLVACQKAGIHPGEQFDLSRLRTLGATGSPLPGSAARWVYDEVGPDVMVGSFSGGTDVCTGFVGPSPLHPVWPGEISCRCMGAPVDVFDDGGRSVVGDEGELVLTAPVPSMPVGFWGDPTGERYRAAYFERFPGVWAHGDRATLTDRGTVVITGRSDGTLNRGGVRIGTAELYEVVESHPGVADSLVVHLDDPSGGPGEIWLLVVPTSDASGAAGATGGAAAAEKLEEELKAALRRDLSPRHVPDRVVQVPAVPRTLSGKKLEVPVKRILSGADPEDALTVAALANPESLGPILSLAGQRRPPGSDRTT